MTIWYDYTTTLRNTGRSGIANVEWSIGEALRSNDPTVQGFAMTDRRKLVEIDPETDLASTIYAGDEAAPVAWPVAASPTWRDDIRLALSALLGARATPWIRIISASYQLPKRVVRRLRSGPSPRSRRDDLSTTIGPGDVVVSMGADWSGEIPRQLASLRRRTGCRVVCMVYDLIPLTHPHLAFHNDPELFTDYYRRLVEASDLVTCISHQSRDDLIAFASEQNLALPRAEVLRLGETSAQSLVTRSPDDIAAGDFYLWVGTIERRKNLELLYDALRILESEQVDLPTVVVAGAVGWGVDDLLAELELGNTAASRSLVRLGSVDERTLDGLYRRARALLFPSHYEGWGLPVREALIRGCPVAAGDSAAVREAAGGDPSVVFLPVDDAGPWADFLRVVPPERPAAEQYSWIDTARALAGLVDETR